jgi:hypothetical protein
MDKADPAARKADIPERLRRASVVAALDVDVDVVVVLVAPVGMTTEEAETGALSETKEGLLPVQVVVYVCLSCPY